MELGDGDTVSGVGLYEVSHLWVDGSGEGTTYSLELLVSDGFQSSENSASEGPKSRAKSSIL